MGELDEFPVNILGSGEWRQSRARQCPPQPPAMTPHTAAPRHSPAAPPHPLTPAGNSLIFLSFSYDNFVFVSLSPFFFFYSSFTYPLIDDFVAYIYANTSSLLFIIYLRTRILLRRRSTLSSLFVVFLVCSMLSVGQSGQGSPSGISTSTCPVSLLPAGMSAAVVWEPLCWVRCAVLCAPPRPAPPHLALRSAS